MPSFEISDTDAAEIRLEFLTFWDGYMEPAQWLKLRLLQLAPPEVVKLQQDQEMYARYGDQLGAPRPRLPWLRDGSRGDELQGMRAPARERICVALPAFQKRLAPCSMCVSTGRGTQHGGRWTKN